MSNHILISYSPEDDFYTRKLAQDVRRRGFGVWLADRAGPMELWEKTLVAAIETAGAVMVVVSSTAATNEWVQREVQLAQSEEKPIYPLLLEGDKLTYLDVPNYLQVPFGRLPNRQWYMQLAQTVPSVVFPDAYRAKPAKKDKGLSRQPFEPELILIPGGEFPMGSDPARDPQSEASEQPQHTLTLPDYAISRTPVTNAQYMAFVQATRHDAPSLWKDGKIPADKEHNPANYVSWYDALDYCRWLTEATDKVYRLPSEPEWEKAARGTDGRIYPWGDAWEWERCNSQHSGLSATSPVSAYPQGASPHGLIDMVGNVWEWTRSLWGPDFNKPQFGYPYDADDGREDEAAEDKVLRVVRGGSYLNPPAVMRCTARYWYHPRIRDDNFGFRVVAWPKEQPARKRR